jgi:hypothetical protein
LFCGYRHRIGRVGFKVVLLSEYDKAANSGVCAGKSLSWLITEFKLGREGGKETGLGTVKRW